MTALLADQSDIDIALEQAQSLEDDGFPTAAECIRACARTAQAALNVRERDRRAWAPADQPISEP